jgi:hypothetical protein
MSRVEAMQFLEEEEEEEAKRTGNEEHPKDKEENM